MAPEQLLGKAVDTRSDLFSFGAVLYEMSTGRPAFGGPDRGALFDAILNREPMSVSRLNYDLPADLERIVRKAIAKRPDERYQNALDLLTDLRALRRQLESGVEPETGATASAARSDGGRLRPGAGRHRQRMVVDR